MILHLLIRDKLRAVELPAVMGILNISPDSFFNGSIIRSNSELLAKAEKMISDGAAILDIGAISTKPGAKKLTPEIELQRILPSFRELRKNFPSVLLSADTYQSETASVLLSEGADLINDISGGTIDESFFETVAKAKVPYIMMHIQGTPENMQVSPKYDNIVTEMNFFFSRQVSLARQAGIQDIIIDPGFGFGKTMEHNFELLAKLEFLKFHELPLLVGLSRKSMIYKTLKTEPEQALSGTVALNTIALMKGASILRVHDVREAIDCILLYNSMSKFC